MDIKVRTTLCKIIKSTTEKYCCYKSFNLNWSDIRILWMDWNVVQVISHVCRHMKVRNVVLEIQ